MKSIAFDGDFRISSPYGWRTDPITGARAFHNGIDVATPMRTPIKARESGTVRISTKDSYGGLYIQVKMNDGRGYYQLHLDESCVKVGQSVSQGQLLGYSGNSGNSTGPHTHFGLQTDATVWGSCIDPTDFFTLQYEPARFSKGDVLVFTDIQNIRKGSGTNYEVIRQSTKGETFTVVDNPRVANGYTWYDTGNGWAADVNKFEKYIAPIPTPDPTIPPAPEPQPEVPTDSTTQDIPTNTPISQPAENAPTGSNTNQSENKTFFEILLKFFTDLLQRLIKSE